jgi:hypothetical protein
MKENLASDNEADISPQADDNEILSKHEDDSVSYSSSEGELPRDDVPELFSDEEEGSENTNEM